MKTNTDKSGSTLVEVMMATVVLMVIAIAGGAYVVQSHSVMAANRTRCLALARADSRMEEMRATGYGPLAGLIAGGTTNLVRSGAIWVGGASETFDVGEAKGLVLKTSIANCGAALSVPNTEAIMISVQASYRPGYPADVIMLQTICSPTIY